MTDAETGTLAWTKVGDELFGTINDRIEYRIEVMPISACLFPANSPVLIKSVRRADSEDLKAYASIHWADSISRGKDDHAS